jgi:starch phosphorylase
MTLSLQSLPAPNPRSADPEVLAREIVERLAYRVGKDPKVAKPHDWLQAVILITRDRAIEYVLGTLAVFEAVKSAGAQVKILPGTEGSLRLM